jgi:RNA polymerase sigma factor (sigma-70 family)
MHWICNNGGAEPDAADIFQEAMVVLFEKAQHEDFRLTCKIGTYVFAVAKHLWYKRLEQRKRQPAALTDNDGEESNKDWTYEEDIGVHEERELHYVHLDAALEQIGEPCRSLLKAFYHHDKSMQEIAEDFGYTNQDNAKTQKYKCLSRLKKIFFATGHNRI